MNETKLADPDDILSFFSPRLREVLRRLAYADRRDEHQEITWLIEARATGKLLCQETSATPLISSENLPAPLVEQATLFRKFEPEPGKGKKRPPWLSDEPPSDRPNKT